MAKVFEHEWLLDELRDYSSFKTKSMFGGLAVYLFEKQMFVLVEPTKSGRWTWHGVLLCTDYEHHAALVKEFSGFAPHEAIKKWLYLESAHEDFETTMNKVISKMTLNDERIGIFPKPKKK